MRIETHPSWLRPSKIPLTIVCGPPCSGKTTYVNKNKSKGDIVIDLDAICMALKPGVRQWSEARADDKLFMRAMRIRNLMLGKLANTNEGQAWFIVGAPTIAERAWWSSKLCGAVVLLNPGIEECRRRAIMRKTPRAIEGINKWDASADLPWKPAVYRPAVKLDGWPEVNDDCW
jgi:hypothetical protein